MSSAPQTISEMFHASVARHPDAPALGAIVDGRLSWRTWQEVQDDVVRWAGALARLGVEPGAHVAQIGPNRYAWIITDLAIHQLGGVHVPLHAALTAGQCCEQIADSQARVVVLDQRLPSAAAIASSLPPDVNSIAHDQLQQQAAEQPTDGPTASPCPRSADDMATILYTSGTTGQPLGVMLTHGNVSSNVVATMERVEPPGEELRLCVLPLSHIYGRTCDLYSWLSRGTRLALAESRETILRDCQLVNPTVINAVPYFYRKVAHALQEKLGEVDDGALKQALGGALDFCFCGGAGIAPEIESFYADRNLPILSGYGLTEAAPVITAASVRTYRPGTVGTPLSNTEVRLADDGEILARGPGIFPGYWQNKPATEAAVRDGWLHTGDLGEWDGDNLRIMGRKKEIIVLATGKNIAPTYIEQLLAGSPLVEQVCVVGNERNYLTALIVPNPTALREEIRSRRLWVWSKRRALRHPTVRELYRQEIDRRLTAAASFEQIGEFTLLPRAFEAEAGELTPKMSLRRNNIQQNFAREIDRMYRANTRRSDASATTA